MLRNHYRSVDQSLPYGIYIEIEHLLPNSVFGLSPESLKRGAGGIESERRSVHGVRLGS